MLHFNTLTPQLTASTITEGILSLKPNQLLMAKILEIFPDQTAKILFNGQSIIAKLEAPLKKGERYLFEVAANTNTDTIILKKIQGDPAKATSEQILHKWNMTSNENQRKAVDIAISDKVPLTKENIKMIADILQLTSDVPHKERRQVIHQMLQLQLPAKPSSVQAVISAKTKHNGQMEMQSLYDSLVTLPRKDITIEKSISLLESIFGFQTKSLKSEPSTSNMYNVKTTGLHENTKQPEQQSKTVQMDAIKSSTNGLSYILQDDPSLHESLKKSAVNLADGSNRHPASDMFLQAVEKWLIKSGLSHERNLLQNPEQLKQSETLKSQLLLLHKNARHLELPENVIQKIDLSLNRITSQQIQNISSPDGLQQFILQIPFSQEIHPKEITIRWEGKKAKGEALDPAHCRMLFWLEMEHLKEVAVDVQIQNRILSLRVYSNHPALEKLSGAFIPALKKSLNEMKYTLSSLTFMEKPRNEFKPTIPVSTYKGMDLRI